MRPIHGPSFPSPPHRQALGLAWDIRLPTEAQKAKLAAPTCGQANGAEAEGSDMKPVAEGIASAASASAKQD